MQLGIENDQSYSICDSEMEKGWTRIILDTQAVSKVLLTWPQESPFGGPHRLVLRRTLYLPKSPTDREEFSSTNLLFGAHYAAFADAVHNYLHGLYRFPMSAVPNVAALLLASHRGGHRSTRELKVESIR